MDSATACSSHSVSLGQYRQPVVTPDLRMVGMNSLHSAFSSQTRQLEVCSVRKSCRMSRRMASIWAVRVRTIIPSSTGVVQAVGKVRTPSTSTMHMRQPPCGDRPSR